MRRVLGAALRRLRDRTSAIDSPRFWRALYGLLGSHLTVRAAARIAVVAGRRVGLSPEEVVERGSHLFLTGWPHHRGTPWVNLHVLRFAAEVRREAAGARPARPRMAAERASLRVGLLANLASTLTFAPAFFESVPPDVVLCAFDVGGRDRPAGYLDRYVERHVAFDWPETDAIAGAIEEADLDLLLFDVYKADIYGILDRITVPCAAEVCTTVQLRFHPNVAFSLYCLQQADYLVRDDRLFCATSEANLHEGTVFPGALLFDDRGLDPTTARRWRDREPLLVYHNKLYKASGPYLDAVVGLLAEDDALELVVMGRDEGGALDRLRGEASRRGVAGRVRYDGAYRVDRDADGRVSDPGWLKLADLLGRARLVPDPWPLGGAYSRVEAYAAGAPVVHMGIRSDPASWRRPQHAVTADHPALLVPSLTATTVEEYVDLARRVLYDESFADEAAAEQAALVATLTDGGAFWSQILARYAEWRVSSSARSRVPSLSR